MLLELSTDPEAQCEALTQFASAFVAEKSSVKHELSRLAALEDKPLTPTLTPILTPILTLTRILGEAPRG